MFSSMSGSVVGAQLISGTDKCFPNSCSNKITTQAVLVSSVTTSSETISLSIFLSSEVPCSFSKTQTIEKVNGASNTVVLGKVANE